MGPNGFFHRALLAESMAKVLDDYATILLERGAPGAWQFDDKAREVLAAVQSIEVGGDNDVVVGILQYAQAPNIH